MKNSVLIFGATGLIGKSFLDLAADKKTLGKVKFLTRRSIENLKDKNFFDQHIVDFSDIKKYHQLITADIIICTLGTTIKKAGSKEAFRNIDYGIPMKIARAAYDNGSKFFILVSAIGADPDSKIFYNKVKGELERDLSKINFSGVHFLQPSLLIGDRGEFRLGEQIGKILAPLYSPFLPAKYKPIKAHTIAEKIHSICQNPAPGIHSYAGKDLYPVK